MSPGARCVRNNLLVYVPLCLYAAVTLIPFVYLACSSIKPGSVFFSSPFIPEEGLFKIDPSTGELSVVDVSLLPKGEGASRVYRVMVEVKAVGQEHGRVRELSVGYGPVGDHEAHDFVLPAIDHAKKLRAVNTVVGRVDPLVGVEPGTPIQYKIIGGNPHGLLGRSWGLLTLDNFERLFLGTFPKDDPDGPRQPSGIQRAIVNSFFLASVSAVLSTLGAAMGGFGLAKYRFRGRALVDNTVLAALVIPGALLIAPGYQLLYWLGLLDTYTGLILPGVAPAFGVFLFRQAMIASLPDEMIEAARIDGCGEIKIFFQIALPMVRPMIGAFLLITYLGAWNNFIGPQIILNSPEKFPLAVWIAQQRGVYGTDYGLLMSATLVSIAPVLILFLMLQKEFIAGLTSGAVKG